MFRKIVYVAGALYRHDALSLLISSKANWLASHTDAEVYVVLTEEGTGAEGVAKLSPDVHVVNFALDFSSLADKTSLAHRLAYYLKYLKYKKMMTRFLKQLKPEVVISYGKDNEHFLPQIYDGGFMIVEAHFLVSSCTRYHTRRLPDSWSKRIDKYLGKRRLRRLKKFDGIVAESRDAYREWKKAGFNSTYIYNHLWDYPKTGAKCYRKRVIAIGDYAPEYGFATLIHGWIKTAREYPDWELCLYGSGDPSQCRQQIINAGLEWWVTCNPLPDNLTPVFENASIYVQAHCYDVTGLYMLEAMAHGLACMTYIGRYSLNGCFRRGDKLGIYAIPRNIGDFTRKLHILMQNEKIRRQLGRNARREVKQYYLPDAIMPQWVTLFEEMEEDAYTRSTLLSEESWFEKEHNYYFRQNEAETASAQRSPSIAADTMPPA